MNTLYGKQRKILKIIYINYKNNKLTTKHELSKKLNLSNKEVIGLCKVLHEKGLISYVGVDYNPKLTSKGIDYFATENGNWLSENITSVLALLISLVALFLSIIK